MIAALRPARILSRHWKLTAVAAFSLSIAMALGVIGLSISNTILLVPPAAPDPDRLVMIYSRADARGVDQVSFPDYQYYREHNHVFTDIASAPNSIGLNDDFNFDGRETKVIMRPVSENYFAVMGIRPVLGRFFASGDDSSAANNAVMTWSCWKRLGSDPRIVGKVLAKHTIIGVAPESFHGAFYGVNGDLFTTLREMDGDTSWFQQRVARRLALIARLRPGVTRRQAQAEMTALAGQLASAYPKEDQNRTAVVTRATLLPPDAIPTAEWMSAILMTLALLVLLIACANVANLLLALAVARRQEAAIKLALGAPRGRLIGEFLKESTVLCALSGLLGFGLAALAVAKFANFTIAFPMLGAFPFGFDLRMDATVVGLALVLILIASLATGIAPAIYAASPGLAQILSGELAAGGTRKAVRRNALVVVQLAIGTLVLVGMGLCQRNLYNLRHVDLGFSQRNLVANTIYLESEGYNEARGKAFFPTLRSRIAAIPGVEAVSLAWDLPLYGASQVPVQLPEGGKTISVAHTVVDAEYFATLGMPILYGRGFDSSDRQGSPMVAVINQKMAETFWPEKNAVGQLLTAGDPARQFQVVGVAADGKYVDPDEPTEPFLYFALSQHYRGAINVVARTRGDPLLWAQPMARALRGLGLKIMIQPETLEGWMSLTLLPKRIVAWGVAALSALAILLAILGLSGALSYSVSERKRELGIRVAVGARPGQLLAMVLRQTMWIAGTGVVLGILMGVGGTIVFRSQLYGIQTVEWLVLIPVAAAMLAISALVAYFSARRWVTISPMEAVRHT
jgi:putative ABC transport system permease protein